MQFWKKENRWEKREECKPETIVCITYAQHSLGMMMAGKDMLKTICPAESFYQEELDPQIPSLPPIAK